MRALTWIAIAIRVSASALSPGLNPALVGTGHLCLPVEAAAGNAGAAGVPAIRKGPDVLLTTVQADGRKDRG